MDGEDRQAAIAEEALHPSPAIGTVNCAELAVLYRSQALDFQIVKVASGDKPVGFRRGKLIRKLISEDFLQTFRLCLVTMVRQEGTVAPGDHTELFFFRAGRNEHLQTGIVPEVFLKSQENCIESSLVMVPSDQVKLNLFVLFQQPIGCVFHQPDSLHRILEVTIADRVCGIA